MDDEAILLLQSRSLNRFYHRSCEQVLKKRLIEIVSGCIHECSAARKSCGGRCGLEQGTQSTENRSTLGKDKIGCSTSRDDSRFVRMTNLVGAVYQIVHHAISICRAGAQIRRGKCICRSHRGCVSRKRFSINVEGYWDILLAREPNQIRGYLLVALFLRERINQIRIFDR